MKGAIGVVDYGMGNLHSVSKALALQNRRVIVTDSRTKLKGCELLVLPGVGSFGAAMTNLARKRLDDFLRGWIEGERPYLGICLGLQLLFEESEEDPGVPGLGALAGRVVSFRPADFRGGGSFQIPHMGWNNAVRTNGVGSQLFGGLKDTDYFYFVHSFYPAPKKAGLVATKTSYGKDFCSSVARRGLFACQFHPEKSGKVGLKLLKNVTGGFLCS